MRTDKNKTSRKLLGAMAAVFALTTLTGCTETAEAVFGRQQAAVRMKVTVKGDDPALTRVQGMAVQNTSFQGGETFFAKFSAGVSVANTVYTMSGQTNATPLVQPFVKMEQSSTTQTVAAYHPYTAEGAFVEKRVTHLTTSFTVEMAQDDADHYRLSDLMYGDGNIGYDGVVYDPGSSLKELVFQHRLSRLVVNASSTTEVGNITEVAIVSGYRTVDLGAKAVPGTTLSDAIGDGSAVVMWTGNSNGRSVTCSAILPPQALPIQNLLRVRTQKGSEAENTAYFRLDTSKKIESGKSYTITISVTSEQVESTLGTIITDWHERSVNDLVIQVQENKLFSVDGTRAPFRMNFVKGQGGMEDFYLGETEVTNALWQEMMEPEYSDVNQPVSTVTRTDVDEFLTKLNRKYSTQLPSGWVFTLPTKEQWQWAYKGGTESKGYTYSGHSIIGNVAYYSSNSSSAKHDVANKLPNELGLYDMAGNVSEMVKDETDNAYGGNYNSSANDCKSTASVTGASSGAATIGLRIAMVMREGARVFGYNGTDGTDGSVQEYDVITTGPHLLEVWGAEGGSGNGTKEYDKNDLIHSNSVLVGGQGGYAKTVVNLTAGQKLYIYVGGKGKNGNYGNRHAVTSGGWNGGGKGGKGNGGYGDAGGGGGATFVATAKLGPITSSHSLRNSSTGDAESGLLIVAGGGGGFAWSSCAPGGGSTNPTPEKLGIIPETSWTEPERNWLMNNWWFTTGTGNDDGQPGLDVSQGADGASYVTWVSGNNNGSGCAEANGGGGGGFRGGNARKKNGGLGGVTVDTWENLLRTSTGGCGGSSWASGTLITSESAWTDAAGTWFTKSDVRKGHGMVVICPL